MIDLIFTHKDNDNFNNCVENLYPATHRELAFKIIRENRSHALEKFLTYDWTPERLKERARKATNRIIVSQFDTQGNYLATYTSIREAEKATGVSSSSITCCIGGKLNTAGGYIWIKGKYQKNIYLKKQGDKLLISKKSQSQWSKSKKYPHDNISLKRLKGEIWKDIVGLEGYYQISNKGRIKRLKRIAKNKNGDMYCISETIRKPFHKAAYSKKYGKTHSLSFSAHINGKSIFLVVSRMVYQAFLGEVEQSQIVLHKDYDNFNNCVENLYLMPKFHNNQTK